MNTQLVTAQQVGAGAIMTQQPVAADGRVSFIDNERTLQEVKAAVYMARQFPRDEQAALGKIESSCKRLAFAERASYAYPKGGQVITGPSIRMAEMLARYWGNMKFGFDVLTSNQAESFIEAYAWDIETNTRRSLTFKVEHRIKSGGSLKLVADPRDIYELLANQSQRRVRACILALIPEDIIEAAMAWCDDTVKRGDKTPLEERVAKMVIAFGEYGVTKEILEAHTGHTLESIRPAEFTALQKRFIALKDGVAPAESIFANAMQKLAPKPEKKETAEDPLAAFEDGGNEEKAALEQVGNDN